MFTYLLGCHSELDYLLLQVSTVAFRTLSLCLCSTQLLKQQSAECTSCFSLAESSLILLFWQWLTVSSVFTGRSASEELFISTRSPLSPSLISLRVSVDVKHHDYVLSSFQLSALGKAYTCAAPSLVGFSSVALETIGCLIRMQWNKQKKRTNVNPFTAMLASVSLGKRPQKC